MRTSSILRLPQCAEAVDQDFLAKDPAPLNLPQTCERWTRPYSPGASFARLLEMLGDISLRDWILMKLDTSNALRPSELFRLRWRCLLEETRILDIQETVYKGKVRSFGKIGTIGAIYYKNATNFLAAGHRVNRVGSAHVSLLLPLIKSVRGHSIWCHFNRSLPK
jgi:hypothetical protein